MTFLEICQSVHRWLRIGNALPGMVPDTVATTALPGVEIVNFVRSAWNDIQIDQPEWRFMAKRGEFLTTPSARAYDAATVRGQISDYDEHLPMWQGVRCILMQRESVGIGDQQRCFYMTYERWRGDRDYGVRSIGRPSFYTVRPQQTIEFDPTPDVQYRVSLDYRVLPQILSVDGDIPLLPARYHDAIVWKAVMYYCLTRQNQDQIYQMAEREYDRIYGKMARTELPEPYFDLSYG